jgi:hypothetical protein
MVCGVGILPRRKLGEGEEPWSGSWSYPAINDNIVRTTIRTSRMLPVWFCADSGRCERGTRPLLTVSSNRELEGNGRSILLLYIADVEHVDRQTAVQ